MASPDAAWQEYMAVVGSSARQAWESGRTFHILEVEHGGTTAAFVGSAHRVFALDVAGALQTIEACGWRLDHTGYVFVPREQRTSFLGDATHLNGTIVGVYVFRRPD